MSLATEHGAQGQWESSPACACWSPFLAAAPSPQWSVTWHKSQPWAAEGLRVNARTLHRGLYDILSSSGHCHKLHRVMAELATSPGHLQQGATYRAGGGANRAGQQDQVPSCYPFMRTGPDPCGIQGSTDLLLLSHPSAIHPVIHVEKSPQHQCVQARISLRKSKVWAVWKRGWGQLQG